MLDERKCWEAVLERDASQNGRFYFGVVTTGVYCRPSCPARRPRRENVRFYEAPEAAERDGLRACLRCRPRETDSALGAQMAELCDFIRSSALLGEPPTLEVLCRRAGMTPFRLQRVFRAVVGMTPRQYLQASRFEALKQNLRKGESVTDAIYESGFGSSSRVYEQTGERLGMTPAEYRAGGRGLAISSVSFESPVGRLMVAATDRGLCFVQFGDSHEELLARLRSEYPEAMIEASETSERPEPAFPAPLDRYVEALRKHLAGEQPHLDLPVAVRATAFEQKVWSYLQSIPYGEVRSYSAVAEAIGQPAAVRAVARACAANRVAVVIPCHRVIRANGDLGGYRWGLERKRGLLAGEARHP
ncbi:MAG: AraC family transcriptional regulator [Acidobacteriota bacterium]|jgi:AraC family transcriptional regulator of adaptative response/methylated-DNA-[protein]-cysteine methyltransferase|nr:AraC family transcriptional regulator [Acidobacteriota bacterium]